MNTKPRIKTILPLAAVAGLALSLAPAAQADTVVFTDSSQLNLAGRDVLAAVNFFNQSRLDEGKASLKMTDTIQDVNFFDFAGDVDDTGSPITVAPGSTLATIISQDTGREFNTNGGGLTGTFTGTSPDTLQAEYLASGGMYFQDSVGATLTFDFGATYANTLVEVQMPGGGAWARLDRRGKLVMSVGGVEKGELVDNGIPNYELLTFNATTDNSGDLVIEVVNDFHSYPPDQGNRQYTFLMGTIVTVAGPTATPGTLIFVQ
jgi:hypothetical protein